MRWDPTQYGRFAGPRSRPFFDLVGRVQAPAPARVVDVGCGSGELTVTLAERWPVAEIRGFDSSPEMIERAPRGGGVEFAHGSAEEFDAAGVDVLISNAVLQWVPDHLPLLGAWAQQINPGGWLAFQVPDNFDAPSHVLLREVAEQWPALHGRLRRDPVYAPGEYLEHLAAHGLAVDAWQTEYQHVLPGEDAVLEWMRGTAMRPVLTFLDEERAAAFSAQLAARLREAYPRRPYGTVLPFKRTFVVATAASSRG
ncbi:MAG TPA: methyltransferase domain-containing protein [Solirubrobacteraceae bacterium]|jgi:trans-aconitate 2-methyltransferase|nr:methyltransferase domain-containing protein [Solirubrobacteraceae bacterium]